MRFDIATLFPAMCMTVLNESVIGRALKSGKFEAYCHDIRDYSNDKHRRVDDAPYGGGMGMIMKAEPIYRCFTEVTKDFAVAPLVVYMSPKGRVLTQGLAAELLSFENIFIICGHYEGVDQRLIDKLVDMEISVGDYVLTGGELPALLLADCVLRMCDGVLPSAECFAEESHYNGLLEYPHYTRPEVWQGEKVPEILLSGHHKNIAEFRAKKSLEITAKLRPDMLGAE